MKLTVDCVVFAFTPREAALRLLLIKRGIEPFKDTWALPGGFVLDQETVEDAARRELEEEAGLRDVYLEQLYTFSDVERDPRERVVTVAHYALVSPGTVTAGSDAAEARWFDAHALPDLAFDHAKIVKVARERLQGSVRYRPIGFELLPEKFTLSMLQRLYEAVLDTRLDKRNFRKKLKDMDFVLALDEYERDVAHRRAQLYRFDRRRYRDRVKTGFSFEV